mmetsp:Transcript_3492/g.9252  ORF Transcript_3492/g.9252 Transcript_3492/m.9252 type:complete len:569 (-) Transcript_3492:64-1770(-)|eukprot:CAMPEP_0197187730 /NCGR_PEP_ID=MMETSP1423-20130617/16425_1 /TAXON_ID=476441 /ORGANISM="Pseudo-nitzschia heimii, Strain UNC1101" /LENGTH=568 /DNA_ID=CAMNT_0042639383 /DNA_START=73 /DNA_END=1779 /DNA_ORIENTATION=+
MKFTVSVTTTRPSSTVTPGGGGGSLILLDPKTGAILTSLRSSADISGRTGMGISSLSQFPSTFLIANNGGDRGDSTQPVIAYGGNCLKRGDNYCMLISIRSASSPPILHWKCRLPETEMSGGLIISPCGYYIVGGGFSGSCYIWSSMGGELLRSFKAHYRSCTHVTWSDCGRYLITGGADCMIHSYLFMDLVDFTSSSSKSLKQRNVPPMHTFSVHHFPVTALIQLPGGRIASAAEDGQVLIVELHSKEVLINIQFPHGVRCLEHHDGRIYAGSSKGTIYSIDLNAYAMNQTEKLGAIFASKRRRQDHFDAGSSKNWTTEEKVFGKKNPENVNNGNDENNNYGTDYQTDWVGHDHSVTSIALLRGDEPQKMISGDSFGQIRIWDIESRTCLNIIQPWSFANTNSNCEKKDLPIHPITSIRIIPQSEALSSHRMLDFSSNTGKNFSNFSTLVTPLQKYISDPNETANSTTPPSSIAAGKIRIPFLNYNRTTQNLTYWEARPIMRKKRQQFSRIDEKVVRKENMCQDKEQLSLMRKEIDSLKNELETRDLEVKRWQNVNNKLLSKLQSKS